jgi:hypothetical protein
MNLIVTGSTLLQKVVNDAYGLLENTVQGNQGARSALALLKPVNNFYN